MTKEEFAAQLLAPVMLQAYGEISNVPNEKMVEYAKGMGEALSEFVNAFLGKITWPEHLPE
jgi:hypothetical protein